MMTPWSGHMEASAWKHGGGPDETGSMLPTNVENFVVRNRM